MLEISTHLFNGTPRGVLGVRIGVLPWTECIELQWNRPESLGSAWSGPQFTEVH